MNKIVNKIKANFNNDGLLYSYLLISWLLIPILAIELFLYYFEIIKLANFQLILVLIGLFGLIIFNIFKRHYLFKKYFYKIQICFLSILMLFEYLWYYFDESERQMLSLVLASVVVGLALVKVRNTIIYYILNFCIILAINYLKEASILLYINYFLLSSIIIISFNIWKNNLTRLLRDSEASYKAMFRDAQDIIFVVDPKNYKILEKNLVAERILIDLLDKKEKILLNIFHDQIEKKAVKQKIDNIKNEKYSFLELDIEESENYIPKSFSFRSIKFLNENAVLVTVRYIDERKKYENQLIQSKNNVTKILNHIESCIYSIAFYDDGTRQVNFISQKAVIIIEEEIDDIIIRLKSSKMIDLAHPEDVPYIEFTLNNINKNLTPQTLEYRIVINGKIKWLREKIVPKREGNFINHFGVVTDITDFKRGQLKIIESELKYRQLFEKSLAGIYKIKIDGTIIEANEAFSKIFGFSSIDKIKGKNIEDYYFNPSDRNKYLEELKQNKYLNNHLSILKNSKGNQVIVNNNSFLFTENNETLITGSLTDVTELNETTESLKQSEEKYKSLFEKSTNGILLIDSKSFKIIDFNTEANNIFNSKLQNDTSLLITVKDILQRDKLKSYLSNDLENVILLNLTIENELKHIEISKIKINVNDFEIKQLIVNDITIQKQKEIKLIQSQETFKNIVQNSPSAILIFTDNGDLVYKNPLGEDLLHSFLKDNYNTLKNIFSKEQYYIIENLISDKNSATNSHTEIELQKNNESKKFSIQAVNVVFENEKASLLIFRDVSLIEEYNIQKLRAEVAEGLNSNLEDEIIKHKKTQELLLQNKLITESILNSSLDMIVATDVNNVITIANKAACEKFGFTKEEMIGKDASIIYSEREKNNELFSILDLKGKYTGEFTNVDKFGNEFKSLLSASVVTSDSDKFMGYMGISRDLTELERIKKTINIQDSLIETLFQNEVNVFIWILDKNLLLNSFNNSSGKFFTKLSNIELKKGESFLDQIKPSFNPEYYGLTYDLYSRAISGEKIQFEALMVDINGNKHWVDVYLNPITLEDGSIEEIICLGHDITEKKNRVRQIESSESNLKAIVKAIPDMLFKVSKEGVLIDAEINKNEDVEVLNSFVKTTHNLEGKNIIEFFIEYPKFYEEVKLKIKQVLKTGKIISQQFKYRYKGVYLYYENRFSKISDDEVVVVVRNVTEEVENEKKLKEIIQEKEVLLKEVHHRVKNNLQIINSILNLQSSYVTDKKILDIINESQNRIRSMSYIHESLYQTKNFSSLNFKGYIENLVNNLMYSYQSGNNVKIEKELDNIDLVLDQAIPCGLILNELITNALKYAYPDHGKGVVFVSIKEVGKNIEIKVNDEGVGLPKNFDIESIESLGLSLVETLIEQIDGELIVKSDGGTKILIIFEKLQG
jgi:PAS domain S-box-containing protein